ncbi:MAG: succinate dehydrogenase assembly factor 2 [Pseudomonadales bacterium]|nr:succinate dehydrogenase assembly factor 2 [Pseudomonadales bacterium]
MADEPTPDSLEARRNRLRWRSRRGMLELELLLQPFVSSRLAVVDGRLLEAFERLLDCEDWDIFNWLQERETAPNEFSHLLAEVRQAQARSDQPAA